MTVSKETLQKFDDMRERLAAYSHESCQGFPVQGAIVDMFDYRNFATDRAVDDVMRALPKINRYVGQTVYPYSVAQHSLILALWMAKNQYVKHPAEIMAVLMHDAAECYIGDIVRPVKRMFQEDIGALEDMIFCAIMEGVFKNDENFERAMDPDLQAEIHKFDTCMAKMEAIHLLLKDILPHIEAIKLPDNALSCWDWTTTSTMFHGSYNYLQHMLRSGYEDIPLMFVAACSPTGVRF